MKIDKSPLGYSKTSCILTMLGWSNVFNMSTSKRICFLFLEERTRETRNNLCAYCLPVFLLVTIRTAPVTPVPNTLPSFI